MEKYIYDANDGLRYELNGYYYVPCLKSPDEKKQKRYMGTEEFEVYQTLRQSIFQGGIMQGVIEGVQLNQ